jgi:hypothetical protein
MKGKYTMIKFGPIFDATKLPQFDPMRTAPPIKAPFTFELHFNGWLFTPLAHNLTHGYETYQEAKEAQSRLVIEMRSKAYVFLVCKNVDFTEGRGPMVAHKIFKHGVTAEKYIMEQSGIYGSQQYKRETFGGNIQGKIYASVYYNGYDLRLTELE